jgi:ABC-type transport system involved in multi-copper enzyme maturation permease subunit
MCPVEDTGMADFPLLTLELRRWAHRHRRLPWPVAVVVCLAAGITLALPFRQQNRDDMYANLGFELIPWILLTHAALLVAVPLAGSVLFAPERERGTLDLLLLSPLTAQRIVGEKLLFALVMLLPVAAFLLPFSVLVYLALPTEVQPYSILIALDMLATAIFYLGVSVLASVFSARFRFAAVAAYTVALVSGVIYVVAIFMLREAALVVHLVGCVIVALLCVDLAIRRVEDWRNAPLACDPEAPAPDRFGRERYFTYDGKRDV